MTRDVAAVVAAAAHNRGIGFQGQMPWRIPADMRHFKKVTSDPPQSGQLNAVLMGRSTWESIPESFRPLRGRINVVLSKNKDYVLPAGVLGATSLEEAMAKLENQSTIDAQLGMIFVIGGGQVYQQAIEDGLVKRVIYTKVENLPAETQFDTFFPQLHADEWKEKPFGNVMNESNVTNRETADKSQECSYDDAKENRTNAISRQDEIQDENRKKLGPSCTFWEYERIVNREEQQYLDLCRQILDTGAKRGDRTGTGTLSMFGTQMRFNLRNGRLPLLTTKRTFWRGVAEELLWFISGDTNANTLARKDIHIWDGNGSREFLDSRGLSHREVGDLGPVYGFQWRHFGAKYVDMHMDYAGQGFDQLADCIDKIINEPTDRRIVMSAWNPADLDEMALPPCHMFCQFYVDTEKNELSCQMYQRSADMGLGVPFNIASYALLTHLVAHVTGRKPGDFIHTIGDAHIYLNHVEALEEQLQRTPRDFPTLSVNPDKVSIDDFVFDDLKVEGYRPHKTIKMKMAV